MWIRWIRIQIRIRIRNTDFNNEEKQDLHQDSEMSEGLMKKRIEEVLTRVYETDVDESINEVEIDQMIEDDDKTCTCFTQGSIFQILTPKNRGKP